MGHERPSAGGRHEGAREIEVDDGVLAGGVDVRAGELAARHARAARERVFALVAGMETVARKFLVVPHEKEISYTVPALALLALILGAGFAVWFYRNRERDPLHVDLVRHRFYFDEFYEWLISRSQDFLAQVAAFIDRWLIDAGAVRGASSGTFGIGSLLRLFQLGNLQAYAFLFGLGIVALIYFTIFR